jgi:hypothetical protein
MSHPNGVSGRVMLRPPPPPVTESKRFATVGSDTAIANVASARETPASRRAGMPNRMPTIPVTRPAIGIVNTGVMPSPSGSQPGGSRL